MYVLERSVLDLIPPGENVSIERDVFPQLVGDGLHGLGSTATGWTSAPPSATCRRPGTSSKGGRDPRLADPAGNVRRRQRRGGRRCGARAARRDRARMPGRGRGTTEYATRSCSGTAWSAAGASVEGSILAPGVEVEAGARIEGSVIGQDVRIAARRSLLDDVLAIPDHLRDALWRVESARLEPRDSAGLLVCGMGGSAIGGDLAAAALAERLLPARCRPSAATSCRAG